MSLANLNRVYTLKKKDPTLTYLKPCWLNKKSQRALGHACSLVLSVWRWDLVTAANLAQTPQFPLLLSKVEVCPSAAE